VTQKSKLSFFGYYFNLFKEIVMKNFGSKKRCWLLTAVMIVSLAGCVTVKLSDSSKEFTKSSGVSRSAFNPYNWAKTDYSKKIKEDLKKGLVEFSFDPEGDYLVRAEKEGDTVVTTWGGQLMFFFDDPRATVVAAFLGSAYAMLDNQEPIRAAYQFVHKLTAGGTGNLGYIGGDPPPKWLGSGLLAVKYNEGRGKDMTGILQNGLAAFNSSPDGWNQFKQNTFLIEGNTIRIKQ
jgi:hypothetical protein